MDNEQLARQEEYREVTIELLSQIVATLNKISLREYTANQRLKSIESELKILQYLRSDTLAIKGILLETEAGAKYEEHKNEESQRLKELLGNTPSTE